MSPPDGLLTLELGLEPLPAPDPILSDDCFDVSPTLDLVLLTTTEELNMNTSEDEPSSCLNGRLRPRKTHLPSPPNKVKTKLDGNIAQDKPKRTCNPSKASPNKQNDLAKKSDFSPTPQFLCPYCDRKFVSKQAISKHLRRMHFSSSKQDSIFGCLFCNHTDADSYIIRHMVDNHPNQYFACLDCHTRFPSTAELAEHKLNVCEKQKASFSTKSKVPRGIKKPKKTTNIEDKDGRDFQDGHGFNGIVISCEIKPSQVHDGADIEENITTNLILPPNKNLGNSGALVLDDVQWNKRIPSNFAFHNTDADQILSRLGVVHRSSRTGECARKDWFKCIDDSTQKFEKCFDTKFYSKVASNVQENMNKFLDGSFNFNPDPDSTIKTRKSKNIVVINTAEGFPILLACEQFSRSLFDSYLPRALAPKHKWKWENLDSDKILVNPDQIKRDSHTNNCIITLISSLDIWTQLSMRQKFEDKFNYPPLGKKTEKQNIISKELKDILESREIPHSSQVVIRANKPTPPSHSLDFPASLGLAPAPPTFELQPAVLSGEWVRPRCYVCCACGEQTNDPKGLSSHISNHHPNAHVQYYEIVGEPLLNADILKHLYVPPSQVCNRTRPPRGFRECTKCKKSITLEDLHQHMLDCAGDTPAVRRRQARSRPFGVRRRRPRMPDNTIRKKMRKDIRSRQRRQKTHMRPRPRIRTEVGDAETIRKMIADLPAKRHRVVVNPMNMLPRQRRQLDKQRNKLVMKKSTLEEVNMRKMISRKSKLIDVKIRSMDDPNTNSSNLEDEEDNKPLKPKLKSIIHKTKHQRESLKRQTIINRAKRRSARVEQKKLAENIENACDSANITSIAFRHDSPRKIDVRRGAYNTREHANRGASNNRDEQRPGGSGTNGNARGNNAGAPTNNAPLKHSIARLTANSETHDKSVQFHYSFLVQQECNNTNQHVPSEQHTLFENEGVVSRLDKPPLDFCQKDLSLDLNAFQKSKLNKPRKGLNDCIAMLKNKLVEPVTFEGTGHVSVQCGTDEPIDLEPLPATEAAGTMNTNIVFDMQRGMVHRNEIQSHPMELGYFPEKLEYSTPTEQAFPDQNINATQNNFPREFNPKNKAIQLSRKIETQKPTDKTTYKKANTKSRRRIKTTNDLNQLSQIDVFATRDPTVRESHVVTANLKMRTDELHSKSDAFRVETNMVSLKAQQYESYHQKVVPSKSKASQGEKRTKNNETKSASSASVIQAAVHSKNDTIHPRVASSELKMIQVETYSKQASILPEATVVPYELNVNWPTEMASSNNSMRMGQEANELSRHSNIYTQNTVLQKATHIYPENNMVIQNSVENYSDRRLIDMPVSIPPAHASTNIESFTPTPLDLSSKMLSTGYSNSFQNIDGPYMFDYDNYGTLDLSNKSTIPMDMVVDLSVKPSAARSLPNTLDLCVKSGLNRPSHVTDMSMTVHAIDNIPTDLSMRPNYASTFEVTDRMIDNENLVYDLSSSKSRLLQCDPKTVTVNKVKAATALLSRSLEKSVDRPAPNTTLIASDKERDRLMTLAAMKNTDPKMTAQNLDEHYGKDITKKQYDPQPKSKLNKDSGFTIPKNERQMILEHKLYDKNVSVAQRTPIVDHISSFPEHVYDSRSKLHQIKMRDMDSVRETETILDLTDDAADAAIPTIAPAEVRVFNNTVVPKNLCGQDNSNIFEKGARSAVSSGHVYSSGVITSALSNKMESTAAVSTLTSMSETVTKIESSLSNTLTNTLLSIPPPTKDTTPVYTATDTASDVPNKFSAVLETECVDGPTTSRNASSTIHQDTLCVVSEVNREEVHNKTNDPTIDQDPETARKIAMLPKALVDILGNMPVDHRNQLLNVLPQFVSTSPSSGDSAKSPSESDLTLLKKNLSPADHKEISHNSSSTFWHVSNIPLPAESMPEKSDLGNNLTLIHDKTPVTFGPSLIPQKIDENISSIRKEDIENNAGDTAPVICKKDKVSEYIRSSNKVIDLTEDKGLPLLMSTANKADATPKNIFSPQDVVACTILEKTTKPKRNSDKTASLRAVRIKAPSERQRESEMLKRASIEQVSVPNLTPIDEYEVNKSSESIKSLAIQQAEVSSTQHSNKAVALDSKYNTPLPPDHEACADNSSTKSRQISTPTAEVLIEKDKFTAKSGLVTSSDTTSAAINQKSPNVECKKDDLPEKTKLKTTIPDPTLNLINIDDISPIKDGSKNKQIQDEDSEDDIILAAIVKQKQSREHKEHNISASSLDDKKIAVAKKKKKDKKFKKAATTGKQLQPENIEESSLADVDAGKAQINEEKNIGITNVTCRKSDGNENINDISEQDCTPAIAAYEQLKIPEISKEKEDTLNVDQEINNIGTEIPDSPKPKNIDNKANEIVIKSQENSSKKQFVNQQNKRAKPKEKSKKKKKSVELTDEEVNIQLDNNLTDTLTVVDAEVLANNNCALNAKGQLLSQQPDRAQDFDNENNQTTVGEENIEDNINNAFSNNSSKVVCISNVKTDLQLCREIEENASAPIRRSRRGKSLYIDRNLAEHEMQTVGLLEHKPPYTKKQLIFSKLLLDEKNLIKNQNSEKVISVVETLTIEDDILKSDDSPDELVSCTNKDENTDILAEKCKPMKRKKSPLQKNKFKKKKSTGLTPCMVDGVSTDEPQIGDKDISDYCPNTPDAKNVEAEEDMSCRNEEKLNFATDATDNKSICSDENTSINNNNTVSEENKTSTKEKRKIANAITKFDSSVSSKSKKTKLNKNQDSNISDLSDEIKIKTDSVIPKNSDSEICANRASTCYYAPIAARSTRSKSVVLKPSAGEPYDPYDINFDEIIENEEAHKKPKTKTKPKPKNTLPKSVDKNEEIESINKGKNKKTFTSVTKNDSEVSQLPKRATNNSKSTKRDKDYSPEIEKRTDVFSKDNNCDSDDSSKSDVPLTKYLEEKVRKTVPAGATKYDHDILSNEKSKKSKNIPATIKSTKSVGILNENEKQLRSEQFMESFGFFSERKPRKSNLLATKKISETFHIIASDSDDVYYNTKERMTKKTSHNEGKKLESERSGQYSPSKQHQKRGRKKKDCSKFELCYCHICKREFRRPDNYFRHQMTFYHISKLSEIKLKGEILPYEEEPNYLIPYKQQLDRLKVLTNKLAKEKRKKNSKTKKILPNLEEFFAEFKRTVRQQQVTGRDLSRDEALFIDCCELLKESHKPEVAIADPVVIANNVFDFDRPGPSTAPDLICDSKSDGDVDSITAKTILESEEVRNLENDLISGLKEAACAKTSNNIDYRHTVFSKLGVASNCDQIKVNDEDFDVPMEPDLSKTKKYPEIKEKMYPDVEDIDMFEDKFDKIKRKCRSQAAAAKQLQTVIKPASGHKGRKKSEKKKEKKSSKKNYQNTVLTKGALKGFDGIKVSIPTSDINMSAIVPRHESSPKKKKKTSAKKKREKKVSETSSNSDHRFKDSSQKKVDVYEFMDTEDAELFEFRPSTLMERFKSISAKDPPCATKHTTAEELDNSSESASDGDDFVYMSDDYVCSDDETEDSTMSYELGGGVKNDPKKITTLKRKDVVEKNAVMGKIFKHNAVRSEKKSIKGKEIVKPKANLDQLFDSLLEGEPNSPNINNKPESPAQEYINSLEEKDLLTISEKRNLLNKEHNQIEKKHISLPIEKTKSNKPKNNESVKNLSADVTKRDDSGLSAARVDYSTFDIYGPSTSKQSDLMFSNECKGPTPKKPDYQEPTCSKYLDIQTFIDNDYDDDDNDAKENTSKEASLTNAYECNAEFEDDTGVARQRARRKCTVGKQNVLAETWSSESEPDGIPPRPHSAESVVAGAGRKKKCKKKDGQHSAGRRGKATFKKQDSESRVNGNTSSNSAGGHSSASGRMTSGESERNSDEKKAAAEVVAGRGAEGAAPAALAAPAAPAAPAPPAPPGIGFNPRPRPAGYYWAAAAGEEQEHLQQHGWIVGDSHKKLVTMLAHAKGRKRNNDDKRHFVE